MRWQPCAAVFVLWAVVAGADERLERLPEEHRTWLEEEVIYIISPVERDTFLSLDSEQERRAFVAAFWQRRDSNPNTVENEYRTEHYERIAYANEYLGRDTYLPGWKTDRGKFHILLGEPATKEDFSYSDRVYPAELWFYQNPDLLKLRLPAFFYLLFFKRGQTGTFALYDHSMDGPGALLTGYQEGTRGDFREAAAEAYDQLYEVSPELAHASLSFRTDEGNVANDVRPFGSMSLLDDVYISPLVGVDTSYAERFSADRGVVESDYLFSYVPSHGVMHVLPGPGSYYLHWAIELEPDYVAVVRDADRGRYGSIFDASVEIVSREHPELLVAQQRSETFLDLTEAQAASGLRLPFLMSGMTPLIAGSFDVRVILRNKACPGRYDNQDCRKSYTLLQSPVDVPQVQFDEPSLTDLVLAHGLERSSADSLYRSYRFGRLVLHPDTLGTFAVSESVIALCEPLNAPAGASLRYRILDRESEDAVRSDHRIELGPRTEPTTQAISLKDFTGGRYTLSVILESAAGQRLAERRADFELTPRTSIPRPQLRGSASQTAPEIAGTVSMVLGDQEKSSENDLAARRHYEDAVRQNPRLVPALERLAPYLLEEGDTGRIVALLDPVYARMDDRYLVLAPLGSAYYERGDDAKAVEILEKAIVAGRPDASVLRTLRDAHRRAGNDARAEELAARLKTLENDR